MREGVFLGFDFGYKRIGVAVGQRLTGSASPLATVEAKQGVPNWDTIQKLINEWRPAGLVVGLPTTIDDGELYTTKASKTFASHLKQRFSLPVYLVDERLSTVEARAHLFAQGGYRKIKQTEIDSIAACIILEQWLQHPEIKSNSF
ncbi:Holliday junction resolvase RuvX [Legionella oakridgensis]|uniref:Putative pre-16S rRNA nuclease n=2 Tax=Legionella oakridgensis TaxID=29423 RepID=W0BHP9_9GAMM|nr:Holliday junction resolvase RuvX [Legionella oakridgensis]AHE67929.1 RNAse H-fold protein YqgF [Legionella oakridgensis ATCC 33761 = DSM 21215]ETO92562.1 RNAse H-fold protein YqgF [Legionella oakridgensis RV-2-2007]KTD38748.1 Holliday junction resolvase-like protein [Legionella oakridgensis]STY20932.1 putative ribonuclease [Legionella longbeachae]